MAGAAAGQKAGAEAGAEAAARAATEVATKTLKEALAKMGTFNKPVGIYLQHIFLYTGYYTGPRRCVLIIAFMLLFTLSLVSFQNGE